MNIKREAGSGSGRKWIFSFQKNCKPMSDMGWGSNIQDCLILFSIGRWIKEHFKHFRSARNYWTLIKYPVIFNQPTACLNYCISTSNFLSSCHFMTMTSSRGWRQRGCLYPPISNCTTMVGGYFLEFMPLLVTFQTVRIKKYIKYERRRFQSFFCNVWCIWLEFCIFKRYFIIFIKNVVELKLLFNLNCVFTSFFQVLRSFL